MKSTSSLRLRREQLGDLGPDESRLVVGGGCTEQCPPESADSCECANPGLLALRVPAGA